MKIQFWSVGKVHNPIFKTAIEEYTGRIKHYFPVSWKVFPPAPPGKAVPGGQKKQEAEAVMAALVPADILIALVELGRQMTSINLARMIEQNALDSTRNLIFLIGGAYGLDDAVLKRSNYTWSLSKLTLPHQLARLLLAEQVYRACTIIRNEKYHHQ